MKTTLKKYESEMTIFIGWAAPAPHQLHFLKRKNKMPKTSIIING